jgi:monooxygenase
MSIINEIKDNVYDVIIVGAGISGIGAAYHILNKCHNKKIALLEGRASIGGTWDLFKYSGIRSDSDMQTLGFSFNPWKNPKAIADGPSILEYIKQTSKRFGIDKYIKFNHSVKAATWSDTENLWTIEIQPNPAITTTLMKCKFLFMCSGYYNYAKGFSPEFHQSELFKGAIIHPQKWDTNLSYENKNVVVIGSGATAITIAPEMAKKANKVVLLQRSPTYIINMPSEDIVANSLRKVLPENLAYNITRWKNIFIGIGL